MKDTLNYGGTMKSKKAEYILSSPDGKIKYPPGVVLEICTSEKSHKALLIKVQKALLKAGILLDPIWTTTIETASRNEKVYTLPIFLPKGLVVRYSKFDKKILDDFHSKHPEGSIKDT